jgi:hypothetical protein
MLNAICCVINMLLHCIHDLVQLSPAVSEPTYTMYLIVFYQTQLVCTQQHSTYMYYMYTYTHAIVSHTAGPSMHSYIHVVVTSVCE